jgi:hypothetical protein
VPENDVLTVAQTEALLRIDRHVDALSDKVEERFGELEKVIWKTGNGKPGLVATVSRLTDQMDSILRWLRAIGIAATLAFLSTISLIVAERMANGGG